MPSLPEHRGGFKEKDQTTGRPRYPCGWDGDMGETVYRFLLDDAREGMCDSMGVLNAKTVLRLSPPDSGTGGVADEIGRAHV